MPNTGDMEPTTTQPARDFVEEGRRRALGLDRRPEPESAVATVFAFGYFAFAFLFIAFVVIAGIIGLVVGSDSVPR